MPSTCILTDSTVQFPIPAFDGRKLVSIIGMHILDATSKAETEERLKAHDLPSSSTSEPAYLLQPPTIEELERIYLQLNKSYDEIVVITHTADLSATYQHAKQAAHNLKGKVKVEVIDSETIATGLGLIVQEAAREALQGASASEISESIRSFLPRVYTLLCIKGLTYLHVNGYLGLSQAIVGEYLKMLPIYVLEGGKLSPTQKARNHRHLIDLLYEFISEFDILDHIGLIQGVPPFENETRGLRERLVESYDATPVSEHIISPELALMIGPHSLGLFVLQSE